MAKKETRGRKKKLNKLKQISVGLYQEEINGMKGLALVEKSTVSSLGANAIRNHLIKFGYIYNNTEERK